MNKGEEYGITESADVSAGDAETAL